MKIYNSTHSFNTGSTYNDNIDIINTMAVVRNEEFGFFVSFDIEKEAYICLNSHFDLPWWGLGDRYRFELSFDKNENISIRANLCLYIADDDGTLYADILSDEPALYYKKGKVPIYIGGKVFDGFTEKKLNLRLNLYKANAYDTEALIESKDFTVDILNFTLQKNDNTFFLDLWQHPCSLARTHGLKYFCEEHFVLIEKYIKSLADLGQKVIDLIVSDFPWAGQACFETNENPSRLYEYNIVKVYRKKAI